jgi:hypothetical protein
MHSCHELIKHLYCVQTNEPDKAVGPGRINCRSRWKQRNCVREEISRIIAGRNAVFIGSTDGPEKAD